MSLINTLSKDLPSKTAKTTENPDLEQMESLKAASDLKRESFQFM